MPSLSEDMDLITDFLTPASLRKLTGKNLNKLDRYLLAPHASTERHYQSVVIPHLSVPTPTLLMLPGARSANARRSAGVAVPALTAIDAGLAAEVTQVNAAYFGLRRYVPTTEDFSQMPLVVTLYAD